MGTPNTFHLLCSSAEQFVLHDDRVLIKPSLSQNCVVARCTTSVMGTASVLFVAAFSCVCSLMSFYSLSRLTVKQKFWFPLKWQRLRPAFQRSPGLYLSGLIQCARARACTRAHTHLQCLPLACSSLSPSFLAPEFLGLPQSGWYGGTQKERCFSSPTELEYLVIRWGEGED